MRPLTGSGQAGLNSYRLVLGKPVVAEEIVFNGGLSYDETGVLDQPGTMAIPPCARIEDIEKKHDRTVLPLFHMLCCRRKTGGGPAEALAEALDYIVNASGLDSNRRDYLLAGPVDPAVRASRPQDERQNAAARQRDILKELRTALSDALQRDGNALSDADTHGRQGKAPSPFGKFEGGRAGNARA